MRPFESILPHPDARPLAITLVIGVSLYGCGALVGIEQLSYEPARDASAGDAPGQADRAEGDVGGEPAYPCIPAQVSSDSHNCGACKDYRLNSECRYGLCQPIPLAHELNAGAEFDVSNDGYVYYTESTRRN